MTDEPGPAVPRDRPTDYTEEQASLRRDFARQQFGTELHHVEP